MVMTSYANSIQPLATVPSPGLNLLRQAKVIKPVPATTELSFTIWLKLRNKDALDRLVQDIYDANSPRYHHYLTPALYEQQFAPKNETEELIQLFFCSSRHAGKHNKP